MISDCLKINIIY